ncbi:outer membrane beta-barrel protein [Pedobacter sp. SYSU D00535]|uniref:outer membrane beta-barrel protein n=1 Tax=Pedobacter sp. SYSU D00535 TaxID=2810308 RepID=UPI001A96D86A|nr:outer membrane beta-barrel protein [Pedobacter sp. SYSU D00535]
MKNLFLTALFAACTFCANSQTKGTNAIGFGGGFHTQTPAGSRQESDGFNVSLNYGKFIRDNVKLRASAHYSKQDYESAISKLQSNAYSISTGYGKYYPIVGKLLGFIEGSGGVLRASREEEYNNSGSSTFKTNSYSLAANGGLGLFLSKRFAIETQLIGTELSLSSEKQVGGGRQTTTSFNFSTTKYLDNLGFNIYFLF